MAEKDKAENDSHGARPQRGAGQRTAVIVFCISAIHQFAAMGEKERRAVVEEIAALQERGLDLHDAAKKYTLRSLPGKYTALELLVRLYVGWKQVEPTRDHDIEFAAEYEEAWKAIQSLRDR